MLNNWYKQRKQQIWSNKW